MKSKKKSRPAYYAVLESEAMREFRDICSRQNALLGTSAKLGAADRKTFSGLERKRVAEIVKLHDLFPMNPIVMDLFADTLEDLTEIRSLKEMARALLTHHDPMRGVLTAELTDLG